MSNLKRVEGKDTKAYNQVGLQYDKSVELYKTLNNYRHEMIELNTGVDSEGDGAPRILIPLMQVDKLMGSLNEFIINFDKFDPVRKIHSDVY